MELQVAFKGNHMSIARVFKIFDTDGFVETVDIIESSKLKCLQRKCQKLAYLILKYSTAVAAKTVYPSLPSDMNSNGL